MTDILRAGEASAREAAREYSASILAAGLELIRLGYPVLPLEPFNKCPMLALGKTPEGNSGFYHATLNPDVLYAWHKKWPLMGIGIRTVGFTVVDADIATKNGAKAVGDQTLAALVDSEQSLRSTLIALSWSGGTHDYFKGDTERSVGGYGPGLEMCGGDGLIVAPPTRFHADAKTLRIKTGNEGLYAPAPCPAGYGCANKVRCNHTKAYAWSTPLIALAELPKRPQRFIDRANEVRKEKSVKKSASPWMNGTDRIPQGGWHTALLYYAGTYRRNGLDEIAIFEKLKAEVVSRCEKPVPDKEISKIAKFAEKKWEKGKPNPKREILQGFGEPLVAQYIAIFDAADTTLCHDNDDTEIARVRVDGVLQTHSLYSRSFKKLFQLLIHRAKLAPSKVVIDSALDILAARALHDGELKPVFLRVAGDGETWIEIDLGGPTWESAYFHRDADTWEIGPHRSFFIRSRYMHPFPEGLNAARGGSLTEFRPFVPNIYSLKHWALLCTFMVQALFPSNTSYVIAVLHGLRGSAKSTVSGFLQDLIDPSGAKTRRLPREPRDVPAATQTSHLMAFDQIDKLAEWLSEDFCSLATGGSFGGRMLYEDTEEVVKQVKRPLLLSGIGIENGLKGDLRERSYAIRLKKLQKGDGKRKERKLLPDWEAARPRITAALFDAVMFALKNLDTVPDELTDDFRMSDAAEIGIAAERCFGVEPGTVREALLEQKGEALAGELDAPVVVVLREFVRLPHHTAATIMDSPMGYHCASGAAFFERSHFRMLMT
jgi:hypothetical protein